MQDLSPVNRRDRQLTNGAKIDYTHHLKVGKVVIVSGSRAFKSLSGFATSDVPSIEVVIHVAGVCGIFGQVGESAADTNLEVPSVEVDHGLHIVVKHEDWMVDATVQVLLPQQLFTSVETLV